MMQDGARLTGSDAGLRTVAASMSSPHAIAAGADPLPPLRGAGGRARRRFGAHGACGGLEVVPVPGWHGHVHREPRFPVLVAALRARLDVLDGAGG